MVDCGWDVPSVLDSVHQVTCGGFAVPERTRFLVVKNKQFAIHSAYMLSSAVVAVRPFVSLLPNRLFVLFLCFV